MDTSLSSNSDLSRTACDVITSQFKHTRFLRPLYNFLRRYLNDQRVFNYIQSYLNRTDMSLTALLNAGPPGETKPQPLVKRVVRHVVDHPPPAKSPTTVAPPNEIAPRMELITDEEILSFSIMAKIILPKNRIEKMNLLFEKLLMGKMSFPTVSKTIITLMDVSPVLKNIWNLICNRRPVIVSQLFNKIREIVAFFKMAQLPNSTLMSFITFIVNSKRRPISTVKMFAELLDKRDIWYHRSHASKAMTYALELRNLIPVPICQMKQSYDVPTEPPSMIDIVTQDLESVGFTQTKKYSDVSTFLPKGGKMKEHVTRHSAKNVSYTPSHHAHETPLVDTSYCLCLNFSTKSFPTGHEGGSHGHSTSHHEMPIPKTYDIHDILEKPEMLEHARDAIAKFNKDVPFVSNAVRTAGIETYGETVWEEIEPNLGNEGVREIVENTVHKHLFALEKPHMDMIKNADAILSTRPINSLLASLEVSNFGNPMTFDFYARDSDVALYAQCVFTQLRDPERENSMRFKYIPSFFRNVLHIMPMQHQSMRLIGPRSLAASIFYFAKLCEAIEPLMASNGVDFGTFDAVLDLACENVKSKYLNGPREHRFLSDTLKSVAENGTVLDELALDTYRYFGKKCCYISRIAPILQKFNMSLRCLLSDHSWPDVYSAAKMFALCESNESAKFAARWKIYQATMDTLSHPMYLVMEYDKTTKKITFSPM